MTIFKVVLLKEQGQKTRESTRSRGRIDVKQKANEICVELVQSISDGKLNLRFKIGETIDIEIIFMCLFA